MYRQPRPFPVLTPQFGAGDDGSARGLLIAKLFYFVFFAAIGLLIPYLNVYFAQQGLSGAQIGWLSSIPPLVALTSNPIWGAVSDKWQIHRQVLALCAFGAGAVSLLFLWAQGFWGLMVVVVLLSFFRTPIGPLVDSAALDLARRLGGHYGRQRMWGSVGFVLITVTLGRTLGAENMPLIFWVHGLMLMVVCSGLGLALPIKRRETQVAMLQGLRMLAARRSYLSFLGAMVLLGIGTSSYVNFLGLHVLALGGEAQLVALAWAANGAAEFPMMLVGGRWFARFRYARLIQAGLAGYAAVWLLMALLGSPALLAASSFLIGLCYGLLWVAAVNYAAESAPEGLSATAQALVGAANSGLGWSIGAVLAGYVWDAAGGGAVFGLASTSAVLAGVLFWWGNRHEMTTTT